MMAAADLTRSRGATSKGLFLIFSLLCLVGFASSLIDKHQLDKMKETYEKTLQQLDTLKAKYKSMVNEISEESSKAMSSMKTMIEQQKNAMEGLPEDFPSMDASLEATKVYMENLKAYQDKKKEEFGRKIDNLEIDLGKQAKLIKFLEELQDEL